MKVVVVVVVMEEGKDQASATMMTGVMMTPMATWTAMPLEGVFKYDMKYTAVWGAGSIVMNSNIREYVTDSWNVKNLISANSLS